jgi:hypothetical protein
MRPARALILLAVFLAAGRLGAEGKAEPAPRGPPGLPAATPAVDGVVSPGEYDFTRDSGELVLFERRAADTLYLAVQGMTTGWVGVGVGALEMNGATIFMGYVDDTGHVVFKPQAGEPGHTHEDTSAAVLKTVRAYAMKESGGKTTLEVSLTADAYITKGQAELKVIYAIGPDDSFTEYHLERDFTTVPLTP